MTTYKIPGAGPALPVFNLSKLRAGQWINLHSALAATTPVYFQEPWSLEVELEAMPEALAEKLEGWEAVYIENEREEDCVLWALSGAQAQWFHRESEIMSGTVFWFAATSDAVYAKLAFGGSQ